MARVHCLAHIHMNYIQCRKSQGSSSQAQGLLTYCSTGLHMETCKGLRMVISKGLRMEMSKDCSSLGSGRQGSLQRKHSQVDREHCFV